MSAEIATIEKVRAAVAQLHRDEQRATADAVIAIIGGGSKPTVLKHMKALREEPKTVDGDVSAGILDMARPLLAQIFAEGGKAEAARNRDQIERLHRMLGDLEAEVEALAAANLAQERQLADTGTELARSAKALASAEEHSLRKDRKIEQLEAELADRDVVVRQELADTLRGFDEKLAALAQQMEQASAGEARAAAGKSENS
jgi:DNA repair exonuclease SbcCD ATPase subunit